jgi:hypothetical protein
MATATDTAKITIASTNNLSSQRSETSARRPGKAISNRSVTLIPVSLMLWGEAAAAVRAAETQIHQRHVAAPGGDQCGEVGVPGVAGKRAASGLQHKRRTEEQPATLGPRPAGLWKIQRRNAALASSATQRLQETLTGTPTVPHRCRIRPDRVVPHGPPSSSGVLIPRLRKITRTPADRCRRNDNGNIPERSRHGGSGKN